MSSPTVAVFFYGLFMDAALLRSRGMNVTAPVPARLDGSRLVLGQRATLVRADGYAAYGMLMQLEDTDLERLYAEPGVSAYRPETVRVVLEDGKSLEARCYNLAPTESGGPANRDYARKLHELGTRLGLPAPYLTTIKEVADDEP